MTFIHFPSPRQEKTSATPTKNRARHGGVINPADISFQSVILHFNNAIDDYADRLTSDQLNIRSPNSDGEQVALIDDNGSAQLYNCAEAFRILMQPMCEWLERELSNYSKRKRLRQSNHDKWYCAALYVIYLYNDTCSMIRANAQHYRFDLECDPDCSVIRSNTSETFSILEMALA